MSSLSGLPVIYGIDPKSTETVPQHQLGSLGFTADGRKFRYTNAAGTAIAVGKLCIAVDITTNHEDLAVNTASVGDRTLDITLGGTAVAAGEYEEGFVIVTDGTAEGEVYAIKAAPAQSSGSGTFTPTLEEPIRVAFEAATTVTLVRNKYRDVIISNGTQADLPVGVTPTAVGADDFFWAQTGGWACILVDTSDTVVGQPITIGDNDNGAVTTHNAATEVLVGMQPAGVGADAGEHGAFWLTLD